MIGSTLSAVIHKSEGITGSAPANVFNIWLLRQDTAVKRQTGIGVGHRLYQGRAASCLLAIEGSMHASVLPMLLAQRPYGLSTAVPIRPRLLQLAPKSAPTAKVPACDSDGQPTPLHPQPWGPARVDGMLHDTAAVWVSSMAQARTRELVVPPSVGMVHVLGTQYRRCGVAGSGGVPEAVQAGHPPAGAHARLPSPLQPGAPASHWHNEFPCAPAYANCLSDSFPHAQVLAGAVTVAFLLMRRSRRRRMPGMLLDVGMQKADNGAPEGEAIGAVTTEPEQAAQQEPNAQALWEQLLDEQAQRLRAAAGARSGMPPSGHQTQQRGPGIVPSAAASHPAEEARHYSDGVSGQILRSHNFGAAQNGNSGGHARNGAVLTGAGSTQQHSGNAEHKWQRSQRFQRDFRARGRDSARRMPNNAVAFPPADAAQLHHDHESVDQNGAAQEEELPAAGHAASEHAEKPGQGVVMRSRRRIPHAWSAARVPGPDVHPAAAKEGAEMSSEAKHGSADGTAERYRCDDSESFFISRGLWRQWGPQTRAAEGEGQPGVHDSSSRASHDIRVTGEQQTSQSHAGIPSTPISWGLYARSVADLQSRGKLNTVGRGAKERFPAGHCEAAGASALTGRGRKGFMTCMCMVMGPAVW